MSKKHIFLVEDDPFQSVAIREAITRKARSSGVTVEFTNVRSEFAAREELSRLRASRHPLPDLYVVDLMLPWAKGDEIPDPDRYDARVMQQGPLRAGYRVIEIIHQLESERRPGRPAPIFLYTIAEEPDWSPLPDIPYHHQQKSDDDNTELAVLVMQSLRQLEDGS